MFVFVLMFVFDLYDRFRLEDRWLSELLAFGVVSFEFRSVVQIYLNWCRPTRNRL